MQIEDIVRFWRGRQVRDIFGRWCHSADRDLLSSRPQSFNLDYPVSPYIGNVVTAPVVILGANAGYSPSLTPAEFSSETALSTYVARVDDPSVSDWSFVSQYYDRTNYGHLVASGEAVVVNACAYRSPRLSQEAENRSLIKQLPSAIFTRRWLLEAVVPLAAKGERLIVVKRGGQWRLPAAMRSAAGVAFDPAPVSPQVTATAFSRIETFLAEAGRG